MSFFNSENMLLGILSQDAFTMVNNRLARNLGFTESGVLGLMVSIYKYSKEKDQLIVDEEGKWFYMTQPYVENKLGIKRREFENIIKKLVEKEVVKKKVMGLPSKSHYQIISEKVVEILQNDVENNEN